MVRNLIFADLPELEKFPRDFPLPDISSGLYCTQKALIHRGKLVGAAMLKLTSEAILILDPKENEITKASLISEAFGELLKDGSEKFGLDQCHVFVVPESDGKYAEFLMKHFGFVRASGIPLVFTKGK